MPSARPMTASELFSYTEYARTLRALHVSPEEKLQVARTLLKASVYPDPVNLVLDHISNVFPGETDQERQSSKKPNAVLSHVTKTEYWRLLFQALQRLGDPSRNGRRLIRIFPESLLVQGAIDIAVGEHDLQKAVSEALTNIVSKHRYPLVLQTHTRLLCSIAAASSDNDSLGRLGTAMLNSYKPMLSRENDPGKLMPEISALVSAAASSTLSQPASNILMPFICSASSPARAKLFSHLSWDDQRLPDVVEFLLSGSLRFMRSREEIQNATAKSISAPVGRNEPARMFQELISFVSGSDDESCKIVDTDEICFVSRMEAISRLFATATKRSACRLDSMTSEKPTKKARGPAGKPLRESSTAQAVSSLFEELRKNLEVLYNQDELDIERISAATRAVCSIIGFSIDAVDTQVSYLLSGCAPRREHTERNLQDMQARRTLCCALMRAYDETRRLPRFLYHLANSSLFMYSLVLKNGSVQKQLGKAMQGLPHGGSEESLLSVVPRSGLKQEDVPSLALLVGLLLEAADLRALDQNVSIVANHVVPKVLQLQPSLHVRCGALNLLSSLIFAATRAQCLPETMERTWTLSMQLVSVCHTNDKLNERLGHLSYEDRIVRAISEYPPSSHVEECGARLRLCAALAHFFLKTSDSHGSSVCALLQTAFKYYEVLRGMSAIGVWMSKSCPPTPSPVDLRIDKSFLMAVMGSVSNMWNNLRDTSEIPDGFVAFLADSVGYPEMEEALWSELVEGAQFRRAFPKAVCMVLSQMQLKHHFHDPVSDACLLLPALKMLAVVMVSTADSDKNCKSVAAVWKFHASACCLNAKQMAEKALSLTNGTPKAIHNVWSAVRHADSVAMPTGSAEYSSALYERIAGSSRQFCGRLTADTSFEETKSLSDLTETLLTLLSQVGDQLSEAQHFRSGDAWPLLHTICEVAEVYLCVEEFAARQGSLGNQLSSLCNKCKSILSEATIRPLDMAMKQLCVPAFPQCKQGVASRSFILSILDGTPPILQRVLPAKKSELVFSKLVSAALNWLSDDSAERRSFGERVLSRILRRDGNVAAQSLAIALNSGVELVQVGRAIPLFVNRNQVERHCRQVASRIIAVVSLLRACEPATCDSLQMVGRTSRFGEAGHTSKGGSSSSDCIRIDRGVAVRMWKNAVQRTTYLLRICNAAPSSGDRLYAPESAAQKEVSRMVWQCAVLGVQGCEKVLEWIGANQEIMQVLLQLKTVLHVLPEDEKKTKEEGVILVTSLRICEKVLRQNRAMLRWGAASLLVGVLRRAVHTGSVEVAKKAGASLRDISGVHGRSMPGAEVLSAVLADLCEDLDKVSSAECRRSLALGMAALFQAIGEARAKRLLADVGYDGREMLKQVWELSRGKLQYRGK